MPEFRCTAHFTVASRGWSETYYGTYSSINTAADAFQDLLEARLKLSPVQVKVKGIKTAEVGQRGVVVTTSPVSPYHQGSYVGDSGTPKVNLVNDALLVEIVGPIGKKNRKFLRGLPDEVFDSDLFVGSASFDAALSTGSTSLRGVLTTSPWKVRTKNPAAPGQFMFSAIFDLTVIGATTRKAGRPFGLPVGRRPTRASV